MIHYLPFYIFSKNFNQLVLPNLQRERLLCSNRKEVDYGAPPAF